MFACERSRSFLSLSLARLPRVRYDLLGPLPSLCCEPWLLYTDIYGLIGEFLVITSNLRSWLIWYLRTVAYQPDNYTYANIWHFSSLLTKCVSGPPSSPPMDHAPTLHFHDIRLWSQSTRILHFRRKDIYLSCGKYFQIILLKGLV